MKLIGPTPKVVHISKIDPTLLDKRPHALTFQEFDIVRFIKPWSDVFVGTTGTIVGINESGHLDIDICSGGRCNLDCAPMTMLPEDFHCIELIDDTQN